MSTDQTAAAGRAAATTLSTAVRRFSEGPSPADGDARCSTSTLSIAALPPISFINAGGSRTLHLAQQGRRIAYLSDLIRARFPDARRLGILFPSSEELVLYWLGVLASGKTPLILQYPTRKLSRDYWRTTLLSTIGSLEISGIVCAPELASTIAGLSTLLVHDGAFPEAAWECTSVAPGGILQMSSGTTGVRKGIEFGWAALATHIALYNQVVQLTPADCVVSWLPLYHDMGFIAAFVMPLKLGVPIVMIDPITWVENRDLLFQAIRDHRGTICFMPNFGFEVMSNHPCMPEDLASMRLWISCSEPTYRASFERFCAATRTPSDRVAVCYAMAENIFAITQRTGLRVAVRGEQEVVSCGVPLLQTDLKIIDGQIWVRSPVSLSSYEGGQSILDADGFYPTGDMGFFEDGELFVEGRRHDLLIQAGRKFFLNDFDYLLNEVDPTCRGRGASLAIHDDRLGTEKLVILVENEDFQDAQKRGTLYAALTTSLPIEEFEVHLVPAGFITKTSSGKVNRVKTAADFRLVGKPRAQAQDARSFERRLEEVFPFCDRQRPLGEIVDSLGLVLAALVAQEHGVGLDPTMSFEDLLARYRNAPSELDAEFKEVIAIVSCMDQIAPGFLLTEADLEYLGERLGIPVTFEHVCLPPVYFIWQDIIFRDFFLPRGMGEAFDSYLHTLGRLDDASVLFFDDWMELNFHLCAFPVMDRGFRRAPIADLLAIRHQRYGQRLHELPVGDVRLGLSVSSEDRRLAFAAIKKYFGVPIFRAAKLPEYNADTMDWEHVDHVNPDPEVQHLHFVEAVERFLRANSAALPRRRRRAAAPLLVDDDLAHFCSFVINPRLIEATIAYFEGFIIQGLPNSLPYLTRRITEAGKRFVYAPGLNPDGTLPPGLADGLGTACVIQAGAARECETELPVIRLMHGVGADMKNMPADLTLPAGIVGEPDLVKTFTIRYVIDREGIALLKELDPADYPRLDDTWMGMARASAAAVANSVATSPLDLGDPDPGRPSTNC